MTSSCTMPVISRWPCLSVSASLLSWLLWSLVTIPCLCACAWLNARSSGPGAEGNSFGAPREHPGPICGSLSEFCSFTQFSPLNTLVETGTRSWMGRERKVTIWQEDGPDLDLLRKRTGIYATRMFKQLLCFFNKGCLIWRNSVSLDMLFPTSKAFELTVFICIYISTLWDNWHWMGNFLIW